MTTIEHDLLLDERLTKLFHAVESNPVIVLITDSAGIVEKVNRKFCETTGYNPEEVIGKHLSLFGRYEPSVQKEIQRKVQDGIEWNGKICCYKKNGEEYWEEASIFPIVDHVGNITHHVKVAEDVTIRKNTEETIKFLAYYDNLTELPNRRLFLDRLRHSITRNRREKELLAVLTLDIDDFKKVNNAFGHVIGDLVLETVSRRFSDLLRSCDTVTRFSADCFKILLSTLTLPAHASTVATKLLRCLEEPIIIQDHEIHFTASIGVALFPADGEDAATLLKNSSLAMQRAKKRGVNQYQYFTPSMHEIAIRRVSMENDMRKGLAKEEFFLHYQPQFSCNGNELIGVEALVRWRHPELGIVQPNDFIPLAEETGFILQLGEWVLRQACAQLGEWHRSNMPLRMAVNLSPRQFLQENLLQLVRQMIKQKLFPPSCLEIEITETALTEDVTRALEILEGLRKMGVAIAIDDFGTGYSSLSLLKTFPVDTLKIDRTFIKNVTTDAGNAAIVSAVITMAHDLGLKVVAEGVETPEQDRFLQEHGCDLMQGYYRARPMAAGDLQILLAASSSAAAPAASITTVLPAAE